MFRFSTELNDDALYVTDYCDLLVGLYFEFVYYMLYEYVGKVSAPFLKVHWGRGVTHGV